MKKIIYQLFPRWFTNVNEHCVPDGSMQQNGVGKMNDIDAKVLRSLRDLGVTHVWYTGVIEHATKVDNTRYGITRCNPHVVKGNAGSPYAIRDYYDVDPNIAVDVAHRMEEFEALVERTHRAGLKVIIDFVPNHVAREYASDVRPAGVDDLGAHDDKGMFFEPRHNNFYYITGQRFAPHFDLGHGDEAYVEYPARATGNDCFTASPSKNDWYETVKLNYGLDPWNGNRCFDPIPDTWHKMLHIMRYWASKGIDGMRCDMVHMVPVEFWHWAIAQVKAEFPHMIFIAEIYDVGLYRSYIHDGGFDYLYDKVTLYDTLCNTLRRNAPASELTRCWQTIDDIKEHMLNFLENHDEVRLASQQCCGNGALAIPAAVVSATISTCPFMIYAGQEFGEVAADAEGYSGCDGRTTIFDFWSVPSIRRWMKGVMSGKAGESTKAERDLRTFYKKLLNLCNSEPAIAQGQFFDLMYVNSTTLNPRTHYAYLRHHDGDTLLIVANFGDVPLHGHVIVPEHAMHYLQLAPGKYEARVLLGSEGKQIVTFNHSGNVVTAIVPPHQATIIKITPSKE